jgi:hypothetical protein
VRADDLAQAFVAALEADTALITALGGQPAIYRAGANRAPVIPSLEWRRITNTLAENTEPALVQFDVWARSYAAAMTIEARIRAVLTGQARVVTLGSLPLYASLDDARDHDDPEPGVAHISLDIRFEPAKDEV